MHSADVHQVRWLHFPLAASFVFLLSASHQIIHNVNVVSVELPAINPSKLSIRVLHASEYDLFIVFL